MKVTVETSPLERAMLTVGTERAARAAAADLWPDMDPKVRNIIVALVRASTEELEGRQ